MRVTIILEVDKLYGYRPAFFIGQWTESGAPCAKVERIRCSSKRTGFRLERAQIRLGHPIPSILAPGAPDQDY